MIDAKRLSQNIAQYLFTNGARQRAKQLRLMDGERYLGGWGLKPMANRIEEIINAHEKTTTASGGIDGNKEDTTDSSSPLAPNAGEGKA